jgi:hypothetical protein
MLSSKNLEKGTEEPTAISLVEFPAEITSMIFQYLDLESLCQGCLFCRSV